MIAALRYNFVPLAVPMLPDFSPESHTRSQRERHDTEAPPSRQARRYIVDPYLDPHATSRQTEPTQIYDRCCSTVLIGPPSVGQLVNVYA